MFVVPSVRTIKPSTVGDRVYAGNAKRATTEFAQRADRDFQQFVAPHGAFKRYLPYPL